MSVLIKGMKMPESCLRCPIQRSGCPAILKRVQNVAVETWVPSNYRHDDCPLVEVKTPHGKLIDADKLTESIDGIWDCNDMTFEPDNHCCKIEDCHGCKWRETKDYIRKIVKNAPTVIEEEGET